MTDTIAQLVARVEAASGPDRELDAAIAAAAKQVPYDFEPASIGVASWRAKYDDRWWEAPAYTASLDAAMTLAGDTPIIPILNEAIERCWSDTHLHGDRAEELFRKRLPQFVVAACLRAHDGGSNAG